MLRHTGKGVCAVIKNQLGKKLERTAINKMRMEYENTDYKWRN